MRNLFKNRIQNDILAERTEKNIDSFLYPKDMQNIRPGRQFAFDPSAVDLSVQKSFADMNRPEKAKRRKPVIALFESDDKLNL